MDIIYYRVHLLAFVLTHANTAFSLQHDSGAKLQPILEDIEIPGWVTPNPGIKHEIDLTKYPNARCLDGTPATYYFSSSKNAIPGNQNKFFIFRMGGDVCMDYENCVDRSRSELGSSSQAYGWEPILDMAGVSEHSITSPHVGFRRDPHHNPLLWDWNHIYMIYCDGGYYAGSNSTPTYVDGQQIFFNGADIQSAILDDLAEKYGLTHASDILVGGCSAGGLSTFATADWIFRHPAAPRNARKAGFSCSGFFLEEGDAAFRNRFIFSFHAMNITRSLSVECLEKQEFPFQCLIPEHSIKYVKTPMFIWNSMYDEWATHNQYGMDCTQDERCLAKNKNSVASSIASFWNRSPQSGGFLESCEHHCEDSIRGDLEQLKPIDAALPLQALYLWYNSYLVGENLSAQRTWFDDASFPCIDCCPGGLKEKSLPTTFLEPLQYFGKVNLMR